MSGFLSLIFGVSGGAMTAFGGLWWLVGVFILVFFVLLLTGFRVSFENIIFFTLFFMLVVIQEGLFGVPIEFIMVPLVFIILYIGNFAYYHFNKQ
jgi:hypothetical protein